MPLVLIHPGFHKTGTTSVQDFLATNRAQLAPHVQVFLRDDFRSLTDHCRAFALDRDPARLRVIRRKMRMFTARQNPDLPALLSSEDLSGPAPGRQGLTFFETAPRIAKALRQGVRDAWGSNTSVHFHYSTRNEPDWLRSIWWQTLRATRLTEDLDSFSARMAPFADFGRLVARISGKVGVLNITALRLEDTPDGPEGPAAPLLDLLDLSEDLRRGLTPLRRKNASPKNAQMFDQFLTLNRSDLSEDALSAAKKRLLEGK